MSNIEIKLDHPFQWGEQEISSISLPRPKAKHMRGLNVKKLSEETDEMFKLIQNLINEPAKFIDNIDFEDIQKIMETVSDFLDSGQKSGKIS